MSKELDLIEENKKYYEQELADMEYKLFGIKRTKTKDQQISDLEAKLAESEEQLKEELEEKNGVRRALRACHHQNDEFADMIKKLVSEKEELKQQLAEKQKLLEDSVDVHEIEGKTNYKLRYELAGANETIEVLKRQLADLQQEQIAEMKEHQEAMKLAENTITNLIEDNRASQEWYKKQLEEKDDEISFWKKHHRSLKKSSNKIFRQAGIAHIQDKISFALEQLEKVKEFFLEEHRDEEMDTDYIITKDAGEIADYLLDQINQLKEMK